MCRSDDGGRRMGLQKNGVGKQQEEGQRGARGEPQASSRFSDALRQAHRLSHMCVCGCLTDKVRGLCLLMINPTIVAIVVSCPWGGRGLRGAPAEPAQAWRWVQLDYTVCIQGCG